MSFTGIPLSASQIAGVSTAFQLKLPNLSCAAKIDAKNPGTSAVRPDAVAGIVRGSVSFLKVLYGPLIEWTSPDFGSKITMPAMPAMLTQAPAANTTWANAVTTAASTAVPPAFRARIPQYCANGPVDPITME